MSLRQRPKGLERALVAEEVAAILRHDLRNKHAAVRQAVTFLQRKLERTDLWATEARVPRFFALIDTELAGADALVSDQMAMPQWERRRERTDLCRWLAAALDGAEVPAAVQIVRELVGPAEVEADTRDLCIAFECVLENAIEALPDGGTITVSTAVSNERVIVRVRDDGRGMPASPPQPFRSAKPGHAGLGLRLATRAVARCGGALGVTSSASGTEVEITLVRSAGSADA